jgi:hypothetical protein
MAKPKLAPMPRLPKEPSPHMVRSFGRPSLDSLPPLDPSAAPVDSPSPSAYRQENPDNPAPADYKPPSLLAEHKRFAIVLALACVAFALYCWKAPRAPAPLAQQPDSIPALTAPGTEAPRDTSGADAPVYIESVPSPKSR